MFYVRKISYTSSKSKFKACENINEIDSDVISRELKTTSGKLSFWKCDSLGREKFLQEAYLAMMLSDIKIDDLYVVFFSEEEILSIGKSISQDLAETGFDGGEVLHYNLCDLNTNDVYKIMSLYKEAFTKDENRYFKFERTKFIDIFKEIVNSGRFNPNKLKNELVNWLYTHDDYKKHLTEKGYKFETDKLVTARKLEHS